MTPTLFSLIRCLFSSQNPRIIPAKSFKPSFKGLGVLALALTLLGGISFKVFAVPNPCYLNLNAPGCGGSPIPPPSPSPIVQVSPATLSFGGIDVGTFSPTQDLTLTNTDPNPVTLGYFGITVDYLITSHSTCSQQMSLPSGQSCTLSVLFAPQTLGTNNGFLTVGVIDSNNNATGVPIPLSGTGTFTLQPIPIVQVSPTSLSFGGTEVGTFSTGQDITVTNTDSSPLTLGYFGITVDYVVTSHSTCRQQMSLAPGKSCILNIAFNPQNVGTNNGYLTLGVIDSNNNATPVNVTLSGTGTITVTPIPNPNPTPKPPPTLCPIPPTGNNPSPTPIPTPIPTPSPNANNVPMPTPNSPSGNNSENTAGAGGGCSLGATSGSPWALLGSLLSFPFLGWVRASRKPEKEASEKEKTQSPQKNTPSSSASETLIKRDLRLLLKDKMAFFQFFKSLEKQNQKTLQNDGIKPVKVPSERTKNDRGLIDDLQEHLSFRWWEGASLGQRVLGTALVPFSAVTMGAATLVGALGAGCSPNVIVYCDNGTTGDDQIVYCRSRDGSTTDARTDARATDARFDSATDARPSDARIDGPRDGGTTDARPPDARIIDGPRDGGTTDARPVDARPSDAQTVDARLDARG